MIEGTENEIAGAYGEMLLDRGYTKEQALAVMESVEQQDWFWNRVNSNIDSILYYHPLEDEKGAAP